MFDIHKQTTSKEDKKALIKIIQKQNRTVIKNTFKIPCGCCEKETPIEWLYKCFYCGVWFCHKCSKNHFAVEKAIISETQDLLDRCKKEIKNTYKKEGE